MLTIAPDRWAELLRNLLDNAVIQPMAHPEIAVVVRRTPDGTALAPEVGNYPYTSGGEAGISWIGALVLPDP